MILTPSPPVKKRAWRCFIAIAVNGSHTPIGGVPDQTHMLRAPDYLSQPHLHGQRHMLVAPDYLAQPRLHLHRREIHEMTEECQERSIPHKRVEATMRRTSRAGCSAPRGGWRPHRGVVPGGVVRRGARAERTVPMGAVMRSSSCPWLVWCVVCTASRVGASCQRGRPAVRGAGQLSGAAPTDGGPNIYTLFRHRDGTPVTRHTCGKLSGFQ